MTILSAYRGRVVGVAILGAAALSSLGCSTVPPPSPRAVAAADAADLDLARQLFSEGLRASRQERWDDAYAAFSRAAELHTGSLVIYSLAVSEMKTGRLVVAIEHFRRFLVMPTEPETARFVPAARQAIGELERRVARLKVEVDPGAPPDLRVELDGILVSPASVGAYRLIDPGPHVLRGTADDHTAVERTFVAAEGSTTELTLRPAPAPIRSIGEADPEVVPFALMGTGGGVFLVGAGVGIAGIAESSKVASMDSPEGESARAKTIAGEALGAAGVITAGVGVVLYVLRGEREPSGVAMRFD